MPRKKKQPADSAAPLLDVRVTTAPCVPLIRTRVTQWRDAGYPGVTETTRRLLHYWFLTDHRLANGRKFAYHLARSVDVEKSPLNCIVSAARLWCDNATRLTGKPWVYIKVREGDYYSLQPALFADVNVLHIGP